MKNMIGALGLALLAPLAAAQAPAAGAGPACPEKNVLYWQAFPLAESPTFRRATSRWCSRSGAPPLTPSSSTRRARVAR